MSMSLHFIAALLPTIWVVDVSNGPGTNFVDLPAAVAAAQSGDTLIVRAGTYTNFNAVGKSLTIRGAGAGSTHVVHPFPGAVFPDAYQTSSVINVPAGTPFFIDGVDFAPSQANHTVHADNPGIRVLGATSRLVLSNVSATGVSINQFGAAGLHILSGSVHLARCNLTGGSGSSNGIAGGGQGGSGAMVESGATLAADDSVFHGGVGAPSFSVYPAMGGAGVTANGGKASLWRCSSFGGVGQSQTNHLGIGGTALIAMNGGFVRASGIAANVVQGGQGGDPANPGLAATATTGGSVTVHNSVSLVPSIFGAPLTSGSVTTGAAPLPHVAATGGLSASGELAAAQPVTVSFDGVIPFATFVFAVSTGVDYSTALAPTTLGEILLPVSNIVYAVGTLDGAGHFSFGFTPLIAIPGALNLPIYAQLAVVDSVTGQFRMSNEDVHVYSY